MYERPEEFLPERWLGPDASACEAALSVFSKGPRSCFGFNLAYIEMYTVLAHLFRRFEPQLDESRCVFSFLMALERSFTESVCFRHIVGPQV